MPTMATSVDTPYYVLMDGKRRFGPELMPFPSGTRCTAVYGFSNKDCYDKFCENGQLSLIPYPLTKFCLRNQPDRPGDVLDLVVIDAAGPREPCLHAATMEAVLQSQEDRRPHVTGAYELTFDEKAAAYRVNVNKNLKTGTRR